MANTKRDIIQTGPVRTYTRPYRTCSMASLKADPSRGEPGQAALGADAGTAGRLRPTRPRRRQLSLAAFLGAARSARRRARRR